MTGNVNEWCWDWYHEKYYRKSSLKNPTGPKNGKYRVNRGGAYTTAKKNLQLSIRSKDYPGDKFGNYFYYGIRIVLPAE